MNALASPRLTGFAGLEQPLRPRTPGLLLGPYYPLTPPGSAGGALWSGRLMPLGVRPMVLHGQVLDLQGHPVVGATVELWHADPAGLYPHPSAAQAGFVLEGFSGYGRSVTSADGLFEFTSVVPGSYADGEVVRAPHLHMQITGCFDRLVTQVFLPNQPDNAVDRWYETLRHPERLLAQVLSDDAEGLLLQWTAVLTRG